METIWEYSCKFENEMSQPARHENTHMNLKKKQDSLLTIQGKIKNLHVMKMERSTTKKTAISVRNVGVLQSAAFRAASENSQWRETLQNVMYVEKPLFRGTSLIEHQRIHWRDPINVISVGRLSLKD